MSITDELREWVRDGKGSLLAIADRIDAEHERELRETGEDIVRDVKREWVRLPLDADGVPIRIGDVMEGADKYDSLKKVVGKVIAVSFESDGVVDVAIQAWNSDGISWHRAYLDQYASVYRHHHEPTVEDVLREFAERYLDYEGVPSAGRRGIGEALMDEYAAKLRLAGDAE